MAQGPTAQLLQEMYQAMLAFFGHQGWWPGEGPEEVCIGAILTQNTNWKNVEKALANLKSAGKCSLQAIHDMPQAELAELIKPAGYFNVKAKRLKNLAGYIMDNWEDNLAGFLNRSAYSLREDLLSVKGVGRETADSIILYAARKPTFVVDAYTARIGLRHFLFDAESDYDQVKEVFESNLPDDAELFNDYHAQLVAVGKKYCRPVALCEGCPLEGFDHDRTLGSRQARPQDEWM